MIIVNVLGALSSHVVIISFNELQHVKLEVLLLVSIGTFRFLFYTKVFVEERIAGRCASFIIALQNAQFFLFASFKKCHTNFTHILGGILVRLGLAHFWDEKH